MNIFYKYILTACSGHADDPFSLHPPSSTSDPASCRLPIKPEVLWDSDTLIPFNKHTLLEGARLPLSMKSKILHPQKLN